jgi:hypothetical protein
MLDFSREKAVIGVVIEAVRACAFAAASEHNIDKEAVEGS